MIEKLYIGAISGTSVDGLDISLISIKGNKVNFLSAKTVSFDSDLKEKLLSLGQSATISIDDLGAIDAELGMVIGSSINCFLTDLSIESSSIVAIGSHGQTIRHRPEMQSPFTMQIGDPNRIAETTAITCIADFRRRDIAAGGQGAPLVPPFHEALFRSSQQNRVILNIGGISNITILPAAIERPPTGFDTGPGNALMDSWISHQKNIPFDEKGKWAASGKTSSTLLSLLMEDPYLVKPPPKSTGREHYNLEWLKKHLRAQDIAPEDVQATLLDFTASTIVSAVTKWGSFCENLIVCGGGRLNTALLQRIKELSSFTISVAEDHDVDGDSVESGAFAWLAHQTLSKKSGNQIAVTGAKGPRILGAIHPGLPPKLSI